MAPEPEAQPATTSHQVASGQLHKVFETVTDLPGLTEAERLQKRQIVAGIVMAIQPRDPLEMMLAGQCIIFDHLLY